MPGLAGRRSIGRDSCAPKAGSYLQEIGTPAAKHCDGSPLLPTDVPMIRVDGATVAKRDRRWNADGALNSHRPRTSTSTARTAS